MERATHTWLPDLASLRLRADELRAGTGRLKPFRGPAGEQALVDLRRVARPQLDAVAASYAPLCPPGYPVVEDNEIRGPGGSIGLRFSKWHSFFFALEHAKRRRPAASKPSGLRAVPRDPEVKMKRLPGQPLPPPDVNTPLELVTLALRWEEARGWVEIRRPLPAQWDEAMLWEHLAAYLIGINYDLAAGWPE
ncbi:MAG: hypothetical protein HY332_11495 [Chloroflexi bacterium]|nr:hypothetical protein [Chloroflexota bacterium]